MDSSAKGSAAGAEPAWQQTSEGMDRSMLMARDPILFWDEIPLYESELDDNGVSQLRVKARDLHPSFLNAATRPQTTKNCMNRAKQQTP